MPKSGRGGCIGYYEGTNAASFYSEFGGGDVVMIDHIGPRLAWSKRHPWAAELREEILNRVAPEMIRPDAPDRRAAFGSRDEGWAYLLIRK